MKKRQFTDEKIVGILAGCRWQICAAGTASASVAYYVWRKKYSVMDMQMVKDHRRLTRENGELKKLLAEAMPDNKALRYIVEKSSRPGHQAGLG